MKIATYSVVIVEIARIVTNSTNVNIILCIAGMAVCVAGDLALFLAVYTMRDNWRAGIPENDKTEICLCGFCNYHALSLNSSGGKVFTDSFRRGLYPIQETCWQVHWQIIIAEPEVDAENKCLQREQEFDLIN